MSRSGHPKCPRGRARCGVCSGTKGVAARVREIDASRDSRDRFDEYNEWPNELWLIDSLVKA